MVAAQAQLARRAVHAAAGDAAQLGFLDLDVAGQLRSDHRRHDVIAFVEVLGAAHDLQRLGIAVGIDVVVPHIHAGHPHVIGVGMLLFGDDLRRHDAVELRAQLLDALDARAGEVETVAELLDVGGHLDVVGEPFK